MGKDTVTMKKKGAGRWAKYAAGAGALLLIAAIGLVLGLGGFSSLFAQGRTGALPDLLSRGKSLERYQTLLETFNTVREDNVQTFYQMKLDGAVLSRVNIENGAYYSSLLSADGTRLSAVADSGNDSEGRARYERIVLLLGDQLEAIVSQRADGLFDAGQWMGDTTLFCAYGSIGEEKLPVTFYSFEPDQEDSLEQDKRMTGAFNRRLRESLDSYEERFILAGCYDESRDRFYFALSAKNPSSSYANCTLKVLVTDGEGLISAIIAVAVTEEFYNEHPDVIERFIQAEQTIADYMANNEEEALATAAEYLDLDVEAVREMYAYYDFSLELTDADVTGFQETADFMYASGMIEEAYDVSKLFF